MIDTDSSRLTQHQIRLRVPVKTNVGSKIAAMMILRCQKNIIQAAFFGAVRIYGAIIYEYNNII